MELNTINSQSTWGKEVDNLNKNFQKVDDEMTKLQNATYKNKGYFSTVEKLKEAFPNATVGSKAYVGTSYPYAIWVWIDGVWADSGKTGGEESLNLNEYIKGEDAINQFSNKAETDEKITELASEMGNLKYHSNYTFDNWDWVEGEYITYDGTYGVIQSSPNLRRSKPIKVYPNDVVRVTGAGESMLAIGRLREDGKYDVIALMDDGINSKEYSWVVTEECYISISGRCNRESGNVEGVIDVYSEINNNIRKLEQEQSDVLNNIDLLSQNDLLTNNKLNEVNWKMLYTFDNWDWVEGEYITYDGTYGVIQSSPNLRRSKPIKVYPNDVVRVTGAGESMLAIGRLREDGKYDVIALMDDGINSKEYTYVVEYECYISISGRCNRESGNVEGVINIYSGIRQGIDNIYEYSENKEYVEVTIDEDNRIIEGITKNGDKHIFSKIVNPEFDEILEGEKDSVASVSRFNKGHNFGIVPPVSYSGLLNDYSWGKANTLTSEVYQKFDSLVDGGYVTKEIIGYSVDEQPIALYKFTPQQTRRDPFVFTSGSPTILIMSGIHGFEKSSTYGIYHFVKDIIENYSKNDLLDYFKHNINIWVIPVANPSGWDKNRYYNDNNVNLNNNFDTPNWTQDDSLYTGNAPFDQPESAAIGKLIADNKDKIDLFINNHTNGGGVVTINNINWMDLTTCGDENDSYFNLLKQVAFAHSLNISSVLRREFGDNALGLTGEVGEDTICSHLTYNKPMPTIGYSTNYAINNDIIGLCFEEFNGFPNGELFTDNTTKACSLLISHFMAYFCQFYSSKSI